jgi:hypothetical protein
MNAIARIFTGLLVCAIIGPLDGANDAIAECCARCGDEGQVHKVCRPVHTTRLVEVTCWDVACEEICLPGKANAACQDCKTRARQKLMRKTILKEVPVVIWVVEYVCASCASGGAAQKQAISSPRP